MVLLFYQSAAVCWLVGLDTQGDAGWSSESYQSSQKTTGAL